MTLRPPSSNLLTKGRSDPRLYAISLRGLFYTRSATRTIDFSSTFERPQCPSTKYHEDGISSRRLMPRWIHLPYNFKCSITFGSTSFPFHVCRIILQVLAVDCLDEDELCSNLLNVQDTRMCEKPSFIIWGESTYELSKHFLKKWGWLVWGCVELSMQQIVGMQASARVHWCSRGHVEQLLV